MAGRWINAAKVVSVVALAASMGGCGTFLEGLGNTAGNTAVSTLVGQIAAWIAAQILPA